MGMIAVYLIVSGLALACMYLVYKWLLASEKQPRFNRAVLLSVYVLAFFVPFIPGLFSGSEPQSAVEVEAVVVEVNRSMLADKGDIGYPVIDVIFLLSSLAYVIGVTAMFSVTVSLFLKLLRIVGEGECCKLPGGYRLVIIDDRHGKRNIAPFSWWRYVVMSRADYDEAGEMITVHELCHLRASHWADLLLSQLVLIVQWFNPAAWLMREELKTVHEYQADEAVITSGVSIYDYQRLLIKKAVGARFPSLANSLNHSQLKKRVTMMYKKSSSAGGRMRSLALVPAIAAALFVTGIPAFASLLSEVSDAYPMPSRSEVSENSGTDALIIAENVHSDAGEDSPTIYIDGKETTKEEMAKLASSDIKSIDVVKPKNAIYIRTVASEGEGAGSAAVNAVVDKGATVLTINRKARATDGDAVEATCEKLPEFPGGMEAMMRFLAENIVYPKAAMDAGKEGRVVVKFVVGKDGSVRDPEVIHGVSPELDEEAVRVISKMPKFSPGITGNEPVSVYYTIPVSFRLTKDGKK